MAGERERISIQEAVELTGISLPTIYRRINSGEIRGIICIDGRGKHWEIYKSEIPKLMLKRRRRRDSFVTEELPAVSGSDPAAGGTAEQPSADSEAAAQAQPHSEPVIDVPLPADTALPPHVDPAGLKAKIEALNEENIVCREQLRQLKERCRELQAEIKELREELDGQRDDAAYWRGRWEEASVNFEALRQAMVDKNDDDQEEIWSLRDQVNDLQEQVSLSEEALAAERELRESSSVLPAEQSEAEYGERHSIAPEPDFPDIEAIDDARESAEPAADSVEADEKDEASEEADSEYDEEDESSAGSDDEEYDEEYEASEEADGEYDEEDESSDGSDGEEYDKEYEASEEADGEEYDEEDESSDGSDGEKYDEEYESSEEDDGEYDEEDESSAGSDGEEYDEEYESSEETDGEYDEEDESSDGSDDEEYDEEYESSEEADGEYDEEDKSSDGSDDEEYDEEYESSEEPDGEEYDEEEYEASDDEEDASEYSQAVSGECRDSKAESETGRATNADLEAASYEDAGETVYPEPDFSVPLNAAEPGSAAEEASRLSGFEGDRSYLPEITDAPKPKPAYHTAEMPAAMHASGERRPAVRRSIPPIPWN